MMPTQILDIATYQLAPAPGAPKLLIHLWTAPRRDPEGGGSFGAPAGTYKGKISVAEVNSFNSLRTTPFVYDIFSPNGKGGWNYLNSIVHTDTSAPNVPKIRYLNNQTKEGLILELSQFSGQYTSDRTLYVLPYLEENASYFTRDFSNISPPSRSGGVSQGFGRDARAATPNSSKRRATTTRRTTSLSTRARFRAGTKKRTVGKTDAPLSSSKKWDINARYRGQELKLGFAGSKADLPLRTKIEQNDRTRRRPLHRRPRLVAQYPAAKSQ